MLLPKLASRWQHIQSLDYQQDRETDGASPEATWLDVTLSACVFLSSLSEWRLKRDGGEIDQATGGREETKTKAAAEGR